MRVLHLASFQGNIGDGANHSGFRACFGAAAGQALTFTNFEIRETYWGDRTFDIDFVREANAHDLVIVGGGNFFELYVDRSRTGATFDVPPEQLKRISTPIIFNGLGFDAYKGSSPATIERFRTFLDHVLATPHNSVSVRNDGSLDTMRRILGSSYSKHVTRIADCGFFLDLPGTAAERPIIAVNVAADMPEFRFEMHTQGGVTLNATEAMAELAMALTTLTDADPELRIVFVPHVFSDLDAISSVLRALPDRLRRRRIDVAPYESTFNGYARSFDIYRSARVVLAMRFHATVCPLGMGRPIVCMMSYPKMADTLREIGREEIGVELYRPDCGRRIAELASAAIAHSEDFVRRGTELRRSLWAGNLQFYRDALAKAQT